MATVAFLFPGQGSQAPGMGQALAEGCVEARTAFAEMDAALDVPLSRMCFAGSADELALTENTQPAVLAVSVAAWRCLEARGARADFVAGHSLGEYSALVAAGVLDAADAARTVRRRGAYMQEAVPVGQGAMAALLGLAREEVDDLCRSERREGEVLAPANYNCPGQVVIAGHRAAVERAVAAASSRGAKRPTLLPVSAPFHCALMAPAQERLARDLEALSLHPFRLPLVANVTAREVEDPEAARQLLARQVTAPVLWEDSVRRLVELGVGTFVEVGPGRVLTGLVKRIAPRDARLLAVSSPAEVDEASRLIAG
jgi:[acyl-carrier-protein] S-malonyltransferase